VGVSLGDSVAGIYAALGLVAALWRRDRRTAPPGPGAEVDVALTESVFSLLEGALPEYSTLGTVRQPSGGGIATAAPTNAYRARDGIWVLIAANSEPLFRRLATLMEAPELLEDPRFAGNQNRVRNVAALDALIGAWAARFDGATLEAMLAEADIPSTRAFTVADCAADPQFRARGMVREVEDPLHGPVLHPGIVPRIDNAVPQPRSTGPEIGADTEAVLGELLELPPERVAALREAGVVV